MADGTKKRTVRQRRGDFGEDLAAKKLPPEWVVRKVTPDFGLDLHVEVFEPIGDPDEDWQTTGEHFFAQVKTKKEFTYGTKQVTERMNVAKFPIAVSQVGAAERTMETVKCTLDTATLNTVEAMGPAVPVFLFCADETTKDVFYVCLNDYIDKILIPENPNYRNQGTSTIYLPVRNKLDHKGEDFAEVLLVVRRAKLYAAFAIFAYQYHEFAEAVGDRSREASYTTESFTASSFLYMLETFARRALALDIWRPLNSRSHWSSLTETEDMFTQLQSKLQLFSDKEARPTEPQAVQEVIALAAETLRKAALLGRLYEETFREQRLPSYLSELFADAG